MIVYALVLVFATAALNLGIAGYNYWKHRVHVGWVPVTGHIESSDLRNDQKDSYLLEMLQRDALVAEVAYSYPVGGSYYSGHNDVVFRDEAEAWTYIDRYRKGDSVCVYYKSPESRTLSDRTRKGTYWQVPCRGARLSPARRFGSRGKRGRSLNF
jgi:hypothetical protein